MFAPDRCPDAPPIPLKHIDATRYTKTNLDNQDEKTIEDVWDGSDADVRQLSDWWVGETVLDRYFKEPDGYRMVQGRMTRIQKRCVHRPYGRKCGPPCPASSATTK